uniref:Uncharacterized protein n=1 Tax=Rhizophora mucronata TaxID=61149 RepID=A0A2P2QI72_RHIMU
MKIQSIILAILFSHFLS